MALTDADVDRIIAVAVRIGRGDQPAAIAGELGVAEAQVRRDMRAIVRAAPDPRHQWAKVSELRAALESLPPPPR